MKRIGINEFQDKLFTDKLSRRQALGIMGTMGVAAMTATPRGLKAAQQLLVLE